MDEFRPMQLWAMRCQVRRVERPGLPITRIVAEDAGAGHAGYALPRRPDSTAVDSTAADGIMAYVMEQARYGRRRFCVEANGPRDAALGVAYGLALLFRDSGCGERGPLGDDIYGHLQRAYDRWRGRYRRTHSPLPGIPNE